MKKPILIAVLLVFIGQLSQNVPACDCHWSEDRLEEAKAVIYGKLLATKRDHDKKVVIVKIRVQRVFKGSYSGILVLHSEYVCSYNFRVGQKYLIYAGQNVTSELETGPCRVLNERLAKEEMKYLEKGEKPKTKLAQSKAPNSRCSGARAGDFESVWGVPLE